MNDRIELGVRVAAALAAENCRPFHSRVWLVTARARMARLEALREFG